MSDFFSYQTFFADFTDFFYRSTTDLVKKILLFLTRRRKKSKKKQKHLDVIIFLVGHILSSAEKSWSECCLMPLCAVTIRVKSLVEN